MNKNQSLLYQYIVYALEFRLVLATETWCVKGGFIKEIAWFQIVLLPTVCPTVLGQRKHPVQQKGIQSRFCRYRNESI